MNLLQRFREGDLEAFEALFRQFQGRIYGWIVRIVRDPGAAEDLTLETFWRIYRARGSFDGANDFGAWAYRIATNLALSHLRRQPSYKDRQLPPDWPQAGTPNRDPAIEKEKREGIRRAFRRLPAKLQVVATLALIEELPYEEIAGTLGIAPGTVKSRVFRAVRLLRQQLKWMRVES
jgi:RNA polymerase sigma-70 factor, ECF subfamily